MNCEHELFYFKACELNFEPALVKCELSKHWPGHLQSELLLHDDIPTLSSFPHTTTRVSAPGEVSLILGSPKINKKTFHGEVFPVKV